MKTMKRLLALVLVLALTMSNLPVAALATELNEPAVQETIAEEIPVETQEISAETEELEEIPEETIVVEQVEESADSDMPAAQSAIPELGIYTSFEMSDESRVYGKVYFEPGWEASNNYYVGLQSDEWTLMNIEPVSSSANMLYFGYFDTNVMYINTNGDIVRGLMIGEEFDFTIKAVASNENGETCEIYLDFTIAPDFSNYNPEPYISFGWVNNWGEGWFMLDTPQSNYTQIMPGQDNVLGFVLNIWDSASQSMAHIPVVPQNDYGLVIEKMPSSHIASGEEYADGFVQIRNNGIWDVDVPLYVVLEDGTKVGGVTVNTSRGTICAYNSPVLSNDSFIYELKLDYNSDDNYFYLGMDDEWLTPVGAPYLYNQDMYEGCFAFEKVTDNVYKITVTKTFMDKIIRENNGETWFGELNWQLMSQSGDVWNYGMSVGMHIYIDPETLPHDPYLTYTWLNNWGDGWFIEELPASNYFELMPGVENSYAFALNIWDEGKQAYVQVPAIPENDYGLIFEPIPSNEIQPGQELGAGFAWVTNPGVWDVEVPLYVTMEDGTKAGGITVGTYRAEICLYNSTDLRNETVITEFVADYNSDDNHFYIGMDSDWISPIGAPYAYENGLFDFEKVTDTVYKVTITRDYLNRIANYGGEDWCGGFCWEIQSIYGDTWTNGLPYGLHIVIDPETMPHDTYLSYEWLNNWGDGFFELEDRYNNTHSFNLCPGDEMFLIFYLNVWDENQNQFISTPVALKDIKSGGALNIRKMSSDIIQEGQQNSQYFAAVTANEDFFGKTADLYVTYNGEKFGFPVTVDLHRLAFYTSENISYETYTTSPLEVNLQSENAVYMGFHDPNGEFEITNIGLSDFCQGMANIEQIKDNVWKITPTQDAMNKLVHQYVLDMSVWAEFRSIYDNNWMGREENWFAWSRMELETKGSFQLNGETYEIVDGGYLHSFPTGEYDEWGNEIWSGELTTDLPEGLTYNYITNTLTMENYHGESIRFNYRNYIYETGEEWFDLPSNTLTVKLIGENTLFSDYDTAANFGEGLNVVFTGSGSLHIKATNSMDNVNKWDGQPYSYPAMHLYGGSLTVKDSVKITVEIAGEGMTTFWAENDNMMQAPATLVALSAYMSDIYVMGNAVLSIVVPDGARSNGLTLPEDHEYVVWGNRNPGGYMGIDGFNNLQVTGGVLNTTDLYVSSYFDEGNDLHHGSFILSGGTVNIDSLGNYTRMERWEWDEEKQEEVLLWANDNALRYVGLESSIDTQIQISGGQLNINMEPSETYDAVPSEFSGLQTIGGHLNISGGEINIISGYEGYMVGLHSVDLQDEMGNNYGYYQGKLTMTGGEMNLVGREEKVGMEEWPVVALAVYDATATLTGGTVNTTNAALRVSGDVTLDGADIYMDGGQVLLIHGSQLTMNSGELCLTMAEGETLHESAVWAMDGSKLTVNGGLMDIQANNYQCGMFVFGDYLQTGGTVNVESLGTGMRICGEAEIVDGNLNIQINDGEFDHPEIENGMWGNGIQVFSNEDENAKLTISGGSHSISVSADAPFAEAIWIFGAQVEFLGGEISIESAKGIIASNYTEEDMILFGPGMAAFSQNTEEKLKVLKYVNVVTDGSEEITVYYYGFEEDNEPGDYATQEGVQWAGNLVICKDDSLIESFEISEEVLGPGKKATLSAVTVDPAVKLTWSLEEEDKEFATLSVGKNNTATLTAKKNQELCVVTVTVSAELNGVVSSQSVTVTILPAVSQVVIRPAGDEVLNDQTITFYMNDLESLPLYVTCLPDGSNQRVTWKSSDSKSAYVNESEELVVLKPGKTVTITATATDGSGKKASFKVKTAYAVESVELSGPDACAEGKSVTLKALVLPENATNKKLNWYIVDGDELVTKNEIASVSSSGVVKGIAPGEVTIRAVWQEWEEVYAEWTVEITAVVKQVDILDEAGDIISKKTVTLNMSTDGDNTMQLYAMNTPEMASQEVTWKSSDPKSATVDENGLVTALKPGKTVTITATATDGSKKSNTVKIKLVQPMESIELSGFSAAAAGKTITLKADIFPANTTNKKLVWGIVEGDELVTKNDYASISGGKLKVNKKVPDGVVLTVRACWADDKSVCAEWDVNLYAVAATKVVILDESGAALTGTQTVFMSSDGDHTLSLAAEVQKEGAAQEVTWKSSNVKQATVDENGVVTVLVPNKTVTITASAADGSGKKATLKVKGAIPVEELSLKEELLLDADGNFFVAAGKSLKLASNVVINPSNASNKSLDWKILEGEKKVTKNSYASISGSGTLTAKKVEEPVTVTVVATAKDGYGTELILNVTIYPATRGLTLWLGEVDVSGATCWISGGTTMLTFPLTVKSNPENSAQEYVWKSSNEKVATVDQNGVVTFYDVVDEKTTITCTAADGSGKKVSVTIKVAK